MSDIMMWAKVSSLVGGGVAMGFGAVGAAVGEGHAAASANFAISRNPDISGDIFKTMLVGQAVAESAAIFALVVAMLLVFVKLPETVTWLNVAVYISAGLSIGLGAVGSGIGSGFPAGAACTGIARQPASQNKQITTMLIGAAVCQTPSIFALVVSMILLFADFSGAPVHPMWAAIVGAGLAAGLGCVGSGVGEGLVAEAGVQGVARKPECAGTLTKIMLLGQAVTETTAIYGLLIAFVLMFKEFPPTDAIAPAAALVGAGLCMGLGAFGPGIGEGLAANRAVNWIARNGGETALLTRTMLVGQAVTESTGIYSLVISLVLIFVV